MKVRTILSLAAPQAAREDVASIFKGTTYEADSERELDKFLDCYRIVEQDIAVNYLALTKREIAEAENGTVSLSSLSRAVVNVLRVESERGEGLRYRLFPDRIETRRGKCAIVYTYLPEDKNPEDDCELLRQIPPAVIAYGVVCEYYTMNGLYEEAATFDKKYKDGLIASCAVSPKRRMEARKWL